MQIKTESTLPCKVYFIGAGPGDPELITVKGQRIIQEADLVLYAGSLVPWSIVSQARPGARVENSASMTLDETHNLLADCVKSGGAAARVHTGDPALFGAIQEQIQLLRQEGIDFEIVPGVSAAFFAAARAEVSFTLPEITQTLILTRISGRTKVPEKEDLQDLARHRCALGIYLSASRAAELQEKLLQGGYSEQTLVVIGCSLGWPEERLLSCSLTELPDLVQEQGISKQAVFLILPGQEQELKYSRLYSPEFNHGCRH
ncbi:MAG: precorrin-4 C(11)-methyltransferase [Desulfohalobiaceae bacterium]